MKQLCATALVMAACVGQIDDPNDSAGGGKGGSGIPGDLSAAPGKSQIRLLSAVEYRNTVRDLLGLEASTSLAHADYGSGFDSGSATKLDENLFSALLDEAQRLAALYVETRMAEDYDCFDPADVTDACIASVIDHLGRRAFRRPLDAQSRGELSKLFEGVASETSDRRLATETLIARLLASARFLYRTEIGTPEGDLAVLDRFEQASIISYALTGSMPDEELLSDAEAGVLAGDRIRQHVRRLLARPEGRKRFVQVLRQWLRVEELDAMVETPEAFPKLEEPAQGKALRDEFNRYVSDVVFDGAGTFPALLTGDFSFVNRHTAPLYGLSSASDELERVSLDPARRKGVLSLASVMSVHASVGDLDKDRPVMRGLLIKNQFLCEQVGLPAGIDTATAAMNVAGEFPNFDELTTRQQFEAITSQGEECKNCHAQFVPYGYLFGNYDALGRFQTKKGEHSIDTAVSGLALDGSTRSYSSYVDFAGDLAESRIASFCFVKNLVAYAVGTAQGELVDGLSSELSLEFERDGRDIQRLLEALLASPELYVKTRE
jgi:hypothetical protein